MCCACDLLVVTRWSNSLALVSTEKEAKRLKERNEKPWQSDWKGEAYGLINSRLRISGIEPGGRRAAGATALSTRLKVKSPIADCLEGTCTWRHAQRCQHASLYCERILRANPALRVMLLPRTYLIVVNHKSSDSLDISQHDEHSTEKLIRSE